MQYHQWTRVGWIAMMMTVVALASLPIATASCPNNCGGIGVCLHDVCQCPVCCLSSPSPYSHRCFAYDRG
jgi:hypothetical protein